MPGSSPGMTSGFGGTRAAIASYGLPLQFTAALFADTTSHPRRDAPESCIYLSPFKRAWGTPDARCTRSLVCDLHW